MQDPSATIALGSLVASLVGCLVYVLRYVISRLIPDMQRAHSEQLAKLCGLFEHNAQETFTRLDRLTEAIGENQKGIIELLERTSVNGHAPLRLYRPPLPPAPGSPGQSPEDAA